MPRSRIKQRDDARGRPLNEPDLSTYRGRFGANLRKLRQRRFATIQEFADALGEHVEKPTTMTVSRWERGTQVPELELWPAIAEVLGTKLSNLLPRN